MAPEPKLAPKGAVGGIASATAASAAAVAGGSFGGTGGAAAAASDGGAAAAAYEALIKSRPEFAALGKLFKSSAPVRYVSMVNVRKGGGQSL